MPYTEYFGELGGCFVAEMLRRPLEELKDAFLAAERDPEFLAQWADIQKNYIGRPTPLYHAANASKALGGAQIYIKMEGLAHTGAHKINNAVGQAILAKRMGKSRLLAETGAGQHGLATAAVAAKFGFKCTVYMGEIDIKRQRPNVFWMEQFGAEVKAVTSGSRTLKDAVNEAFRDWCSSFPDTHYLLGSALGPAPFPYIVKYFQSVIGQETRAQIQERNLDVEAIVACVGGGSNSIGMFSAFAEQSAPRLIGVEAGGKGPGPGQNAVRMADTGKIGIVQGYKSYFLLDGDGQVMPTHSVSAGLDYAGIGPELAHLGKSGRVQFTSVTDQEAVDALKFFARQEGIVFALESAHAAAHAIKIAGGLSPKKAIIINMSGRGDKDIFITAKQLQPEAWNSFLKSEVQNG